jgi:hypothetical protein
MAHNIEKFYSNFGGVDTRSNKLNQDPSTMRVGSKNFRYNFQDEIQKANGFQHKDDGSSAVHFGLIEYKFTDVNTGESKSEILGVAADGNLRKRIGNWLKLTATSSNSYSFYYDEVADNFKFVLFPSNTSLTVTLTTTMDQLATAISGVAGHTAVVVDDSGGIISSSKLAYLGDCVISSSIAINSIIHSSFYWDIIPFGGVGAPFTTTAALNTDPKYSGVNYVNLNNNCYMADGGWVMKYDGKSVYRAGMPRLPYPDFLGTSLNSNIDATTTVPTLVAGQGLTASKFYKYAFQLGFVDYNGVTILSKITTGTESRRLKVDGTLSSAGIANDYLSQKSPAAGGGMSAIKLSFNYKIIPNDDSFPVYFCKVNGAQNIITAGGTINVASGHNIKIGMCLRIPIRNYNAPVPYNTSTGFSYLSTKVNAITATSITVDIGYSGGISADPSTLNISTPTNLLIDNQIINAGYTQTENENIIIGFGYDGASSLVPLIKFGAFLRVYRTPGMDDDVLTSNFFQLIDLPVNMDSALIYNFIDSFPDNLPDPITHAAVAGYGLSKVPMDEGTGSDLPRACKYISSWQGQLVQSGRPVDETLKSEKYPTVYSYLSNEWGYIDKLYLFEYTEAHLCDDQSFYWESTSAAEGFPQSGLNEQRIDSKYNDSISGMSSNKDAFFVFKDRTTSIHTGTLSIGDISSEVLEGDVGCASHKSIQEVLGTLIWLDEKRGFFSCVAGRLPVHIGYPISDYMRINSLGINFKNSVSANNQGESLYICTSDGLTFVLDYAEKSGNGNRSCWYIWDRPSNTSLLYTSDGNLLSSDGTTLLKMKITNTKYDFTDHKSAIDMNIKTAFLAQDMPTIDKHYISYWINCIDGDFSLDIDQYANFIDTVISSLTIAIPSISSGKKFVKSGIKAAIPKISSISIGFRNSEKNKFVKIQGYELETSIDFDPGEAKR